MYTIHSSLFNSFNKFLSILIISHFIFCVPEVGKNEKRNRNLGFATLIASLSSEPSKTYEIEVAFYDSTGEGIDPEIITEEEYNARKANGTLDRSISDNKELKPNKKFFNAIASVVILVVNATRATVSLVKYIKDKDRERSSSKTCEVLGGFNTWSNTFTSPLFKSTEEHNGVPYGYVYNEYDYNQSMPNGCLTADIIRIRDKDRNIEIPIPAPVKIDTPTVLPNSGVYSETQKVTINTNQKLVAGILPSFRYTTDGTNPKCFHKDSKTPQHGLIYREPIQINPGVSLDIKVIACGSGRDFGSSVVSKSYTITGGSGTAPIENDNVYDWGTFTDNKNGTISFQGNAGTFGGVNYGTANLLFMKCSHGQAYNAGNNDCTGTGISPNFGAVKVAYCSISNSTCNGGGTGIGAELTTPINGSTSPLRTACLNLNSGAGTYGRTNWRVPTINELKFLIKCTNKTIPSSSSGCGSGNFSLTSANIPSMFSNTPFTIDDEYWSSTGISFDGGATVSFLNGRHTGKLYEVPMLLRCVSTTP